MSVGEVLKAIEEKKWGLCITNHRGIKTGRVVITPGGPWSEKSVFYGYDNGVQKVLTMAEAINQCYAEVMESEATD